jgi:hypothetical protein
MKVDEEREIEGNLAALPPIEAMALSLDGLSLQQGLVRVQWSKIQHGLRWMTGMCMAQSRWMAVQLQDRRIVAFGVWRCQEIATLNPG